MRLFVGVELDEGQRSACAAVATDLHARFRDARVRLDVRWIPEINLHITLWFLGHLDERKAAAVHESLAARWDRDAFSFSVGGAGAFPPSGPPRILWVGVTNGAESLVDLYGDLSARLQPLGFEPERRAYHPHVTIGRVKEARASDGRKARGILSTIAGDNASGAVRALTLFRSHQSSSGSRYEPLLRVPLREC